MDFFKSVLGALRTQSLPMEHWELLVIDNASNQYLADILELSWHPRAQVIREEALGLTRARLTGISHAKSDLLIFVDDDNVLDEEYLAEALKIKREWPILGVWGGGIQPLFETEPPPWSKPYLGYLALREVRENCWSNFMSDPGRIPVGAGMCVRPVVAEEYARKLSSDPARLSLGRRGQSLSSCDDFDLVWTSCDIGLGTGLFPQLLLTHLIPANRLKADYLLKLLEGVCYSSAILKAIRGYPPEPYSWLRSMKGYISALRRGMWETRFYRASQRGSSLARREIATWNRA